MAFPIRDAWSDRPGWSGFHTPRPGNSDGLHHGFDYYCPEGTPIYATGNGVVKSRGTGFGPNSFGNNTTIWYDGNPIVAATYAHMNALPLNPVGTRVTANTIIGHVGHTGNAADVIWNGLRHVHEEVIINGRYVDPIAHNGGISSAGGTSTPIGEQDMPLTDTEMTTIAHRAADEVWHYLLAEPSGGVSPGRAVPAGDWLRYSDARLIQLQANAIDYDKLAAAIKAAGITSPSAGDIAKAVNDDAAARLAH